ncbi:EVE domain-containing protein [Chitinimonas sp. BJB300]|uniref:EVE domain-containing protein n=1 Tax=Chitinimonas sp. BJB300 TaxID=1559339 RepID=UPI000C0DDD44|nr:EVE domain-containing protein [Chitinimonas sp. BJB300]PHV13309.1 EVE domain-containing protein [Chitinimonas sp. BJB300]TSJ85986.1 EVE domain-containing protein [Chitinimonas sp. BJB300]
MRYWIGVVSHDHVLRGITGGFCQLCHGKSGPLGRMEPGDWLIYYSPSEHMGEAGSCQRFTAIGQIQDADAYPVEINADTYYRRNVAYRPCREVPVRPMIEQLTFIRNKQRWGAAFRFGHLEIGQNDFELIARAMLDAAPSAIEPDTHRN